MTTFLMITTAIVIIMILEEIKITVQNYMDGKYVYWSKEHSKEHIAAYICCIVIAFFHIVPSRELDVAFILFFNLYCFVYIGRINLINRKTSDDRFQTETKRRKEDRFCNQ